MKYLLNEKYEQLKKLRLLKAYTITIKDKFLSEEMWQVCINSFDENIKELQESIKKMQ